MNQDHTAENDRTYEPEFFTAEELRNIAEHMDWLEQGQIKEAVVRLESGGRPQAWIWVSPHNGPTVQVVFAPHPDLTDEAVPTSVTPPGASQ